MAEEDVWKDNKSIPFPEVVIALKIMEYGSTERVMFMMRCQTGCRNTELDNMDPARLRGLIIEWPLGKNQKGTRRERLSAEFVKELTYYRATHRVEAGKMFGVSSETFADYFCKQVRPKLGPKWLEKYARYERENPVKMVYKYNLAGLRKNFGYCTI